MHTPRSLALAALLAIAFTLAACGDDEENSGSESAKDPVGPPVARVALSESEYKLKPAGPRVAKAGIVEFQVSNDGEEVHALEVEGPSGEAETEETQPGGRAKLKVDLSKPGSYEMYCPVDNHKELGMKGEITVAG